jgi:hypothetical protein
VNSRWTHSAPFASHWAYRSVQLASRSGKTLPPLVIFLPHPEYGATSVIQTMTYANRYNNLGGRV